MTRLGKDGYLVSVEISLSGGPCRWSSCWKGVDELVRYGDVWAHMCLCMFRCVGVQM